MGGFGPYRHRGGRSDAGTDPTAARGEPPRTKAVLLAARGSGRDHDRPRGRRRGTRGVAVGDGEVRHGHVVGGGAGRLPSALDQHRDRPLGGGHRRTPVHVVRPDVDDRHLRLPDSGLRRPVPAGVGEDVGRGAQGPDLRPRRSGARVVLDRGHVRVHRAHPVRAEADVQGGRAVHRDHGAGDHDRPGLRRLLGRHLGCGQGDGAGPRQLRPHRAGRRVHVRPLLRRGRLCRHRRHRQPLLRLLPAGQEHRHGETHPGAGESVAPAQDGRSPDRLPLPREPREREPVQALDALRDPGPSRLLLDREHLHHVPLHVRGAGRSPPGRDRSRRGPDRLGHVRSSWNRASAPPAATCSC